jgi:hypothetical protein
VVSRAAGSPTRAPASPGRQCRRGRSRLNQSEYRIVRVV